MRNHFTRLPFLAVHLDKRIDFTSRIWYNRDLEKGVCVMVDQDLLQAIGQMFDAKLVSIATKDDVLQELHRSEKLLLDEMKRLHNDTIDKFSKLNNCLDKMENAIHATQYSNETVELLLKKVEELEERIKKLEKTA